MGDGGYVVVPVLPVFHPYGMGDGGCTSVASLRDEMEGVYRCYIPTGWEMEGVYQCYQCCIPTG
ncbi:MAG: hypothetical protein IPP46_00960 [Bacteroidetes bacterium]|nr:hypothetical protein [Bacteroidota bacterium]